MTKDQLKLIAIGAGALVLVLATAGFSYMKITKASAHAVELEEQLTTTKEELASFQKYVEYLPQAKQSVTAAAEKLSTTVEDEITWVERGERGVGPFKVEANAVLKLSVAYTFGFDLAAGKFDLSVADKGIQIKLGQPQLLGAPVVTVVAAEYVPKSLQVPEEQATQEILKKATASLEEKARVLAQNEAVRIIVEKKLTEHLRAFFAKQKDVKLIPDMVVSSG
jgi:hypothetical protein